MAELPKYYWDACAWIALIQQEAGQFDDLQYVVERARAGTVQIVTSNFTLAEVFKRPCDGENKGTTIVEDTEFEAFMLQDLVTRVQVDFDIGTLARRLLRAYPSIQKPQDAIHLATALLENVDELHTFDRANLTGLSGKIKRKDGKTLKICAPPKKPVPAQPPKTPIEQAIEDKLAEDQNGENQGQASNGQG